MRILGIYFPPLSYSGWLYSLTDSTNVHLETHLKRTNILILTQHNTHTHTHTHTHRYIYIYIYIGSLQGTITE